METEYGQDNEAPADERAGNRQARPNPPRHISTLQLCNTPPWTVKTTAPRRLEIPLPHTQNRPFQSGGQNQSSKTLGSYRDCPGRRGEVEPGAFVRGSFDRIV